MFFNGILVLNRTSKLFKTYLYHYELHNEIVSVCVSPVHDNRYLTGFVRDIAECSSSSSVSVSDQLKHRWTSSNVPR